MRLPTVACLLPAPSLAGAGCGTLRVEAGFKAPAELTATALDQTRVVQQLGKIAYVRLGNIWIRELPSGKRGRLPEVGRDSEPRWAPSPYQALTAVLGLGPVARAGRRREMGTREDSDRRPGNSQR